MTPRIFIIENSDQLDRVTKVILRLKDFPLEVTARDYIKQRSKPQNARLWKLHGLASEQTGYTPAEMHDLCLCQHHGSVDREVTNPFTGAKELKQTPLKRSSQRNTKEFRLFLDFVEDYYAQNLGLWLNPEE